jgi:hypothetical protein
MICAIQQKEPVGTASMNPAKGTASPDELVLRTRSIVRIGDTPATFRQSAELSPVQARALDHRPTANRDVVTSRTPG